MVHINFPAALTEEEEILKLKYAKLRKKRKQLQALKAAKPEKEQVKEKPTKRPSESAKTAKEQAKKLIQAGVIKLKDSKEKQGFKRSRNFEKKMADPEKTPTPVVAFQPFAATHPEEEQEEKADRDRRPRPPRMRGLYENFVKGETRFEDRREPREERDRRDRPEREPLPKKGNTIYVYGHGVTEEILRKAFGNFGAIVNVSMEKERNCGFVTFEKMESSDQAIQEVDGAMIDSVQLKVSMARRQPSFEPTAQDASTSSWASIASNNSQKGSHKDKRDMIAYDEEDIF